VLGLSKTARFSVLMACSVASSAMAQQQIEIEVDTGYFRGTLYAMMIPNPPASTVNSGAPTGTVNVMPLGYAFTRYTNAELTAGFLSSAGIYQIKEYSVESNQFYTTSETLIYAIGAQKPTKSQNSDNGTNGTDLALSGKFFAELKGTRSALKYQYGLYELRWEVNPTTTNVWTTVYSHKFALTPQGLTDLKENSDWSGGGSSNGGGATSEDINNQNVNQDGFWASLFVPDQENLDVLVDTISQFGTWGPFGIISYIRDRAEEYDATTQLDYSITLTLPFAGPTVMDLSPYETYIRIGRMIMAMGLWWTIGLGLFRMVYKKV
jgi:hypothetical protein